MCRKSGVMRGPASGHAPPIDVAREPATTHPHAEYLSPYPAILADHRSGLRGWSQRILPRRGHRMANEVRLLLRALGDAVPVLRQSDAIGRARLEFRAGLSRGHHAG